MSIQSSLEIEEKLAKGAEAMKQVRRVAEETKVKLAPEAPEPTPRVQSPLTVRTP